MSDHDHDSWLDFQLREVPLPGGLIERLRRVGQLDDELLDTWMKDVPLPSGLLVQLRQSVADEQLDDWLRDVSVPREVLDRLGDAVCEEQLRDVPVPAGLVDQTRSAVLDDQLGDVPVPADLLDRLRRVRHHDPRREVSVPRNLQTRLRRTTWPRPRQLPRILHLAVTVCGVLVAGGLYLAALSRVLLVAAQAPSVGNLPIVMGSAGITLTANSADVGPEIQLTLAEPWQNPLKEAAVHHLEIASPLPARNSDPSQGEIQALLAALGSRDSWMDDIVLLRHQILAEPHRASDILPELAEVAPPVPRGIEPPLVLGFDRRFLLTHGVQPVIDLAAVAAADLPASQKEASLAALRTSAVPLSMTTDSFDLAERLVGQGRLPRPADVRVEDFLAAVDYQFPAAESGQLELRTAAGPSAFGPRGAKLLQIGVQAGSIPGRSVPATHLTVAIDVSASVGFGDRLVLARQALSRLVKYLGPDDRISLVTYSEQPRVLIEDAGPEQREQLLEALAQLSPQGATNLAAGLRQAAATALQASASPGVARGLVLISDGASGFSADTFGQLQDLVTDMVREGVWFLVVDLGPEPGEDRNLAALSAAGDGACLWAVSATQVAQALAERVTGASAVVAHDAVLRVTFNPEAVQSYRLFGHEASSFGGLVTPPLEAELRAEDAATALYELTLRPNRVDLVAVAEVTWHDPYTGQPITVRQNISRLQFAPSLAQAPVSLQAATLAAETAEILRGSYFVSGRSGDLEPVLELAGQVSGPLAERESFRRLVSLVQRAQRIP